MRCSVSELPSRSVQLREQHIAFYNRVWAKDDPFWDDNQPGNLWNCKCDWQQVDDPVTDGNPQTAIRHQGLDGNPAKTGQIFTDESSYVKKAPEGTETSAIRTARHVIRQQDSEYKKSFQTNIGEILVDNIPIIEVSKGSSSDKSYFLKQEIVKNIDKYIDKFQSLPPEDVDLGHNNHKSVFYKRRLQFEKNNGFKAFKLEIYNCTYVVKFGKFKNMEMLHLYSISG